MICSDGLTKHVTDDEILQHAATRDAQAACDDMLALALERGGLDNVTIVVVAAAPTPRSSEPTRTPLRSGAASMNSNDPFRSELPRCAAGHAAQRHLRNRRR